MRLSRRIVMGAGGMALFSGWFKGAAAKERALPSYPDKLSAAGIDAVFMRAREGLKAQTAAHIGSWHMDGATWDVDLDTGVITFVNKRGWKIRAPVQVIGTRSLTDGTWLWGWDHPSIPADRAADARLVRAFGEKQGLAALTTLKIEASEDEAWDFTALAAYLSGANGAYRGPTGQAQVFMTFGQLTISKD